MKYLPALVALVLLPPAALAQGVTALPPMSVITFSPGSDTATMNGQIVPGGRDLYYVQAKAGQTMNVSVASTAPVAFQVYHPDATVARAADGSPLTTGKTLPDAGPNDSHCGSPASESTMAPYVGRNPEPTQRLQRTNSTRAMWLGSTF